MRKLYIRCLLGSICSSDWLFSHRVLRRNGYMKSFIRFKCCLFWKPSLESKLMSKLKQIRVCQGGNHCQHKAHISQGQRNQKAILFLPLTELTERISTLSPQLTCLNAFRCVGSITKQPGYPPPLQLYVICPLFRWIFKPDGVCKVLLDKGSVEFPGCTDILVLCDLLKPQ